MIPVQGMTSAPHLDFAGEVRAATGFPMFHAAKIADVATARHAVATGKLDMVGMTRAHIADPHIVKKVIAGQGGPHQALRRRDLLPGPDLRRRRRAVHPQRRHRARGTHSACPEPGGGRRNARVIVGAGPAGLEAARVAAERGHTVTLFEASDRAGGQINLLTANPRRREMIGIVDWRLAELDRLGVEIRYNLYAEADDVLAPKRPTWW